jgi:hypothetical protein
MALLPVTLTQDGLFAAYSLGVITLDEARSAIIGLDLYVAPVAPVADPEDPPVNPAGLSLV